MSLCFIQASKLIRRTCSIRVLCTSGRACKPTGSEDKDDKNFIDTTNFKSSDIPKPALYLGFGGVIPFASLALASGLTSEYSDVISTAQVGYAACILTFLGGVHWGKELGLNPQEPSMKTLTISVLPSLYAWCAFALPQHYAMYYLSAGLVGACVYDVNNSHLPRWYRKLRLPLTVLAASSVFITGVNVAPSSFSPY
jgi:hypothetical protein